MSIFQLIVDVKRADTGGTMEGVADGIMAGLQQNPIIGTLLALILLDIVTGLLAAYISREVSSIASFRGMLKKVMMLAMVAAGCVMEQIYSDIPWGRLIAMFFCVTELISITENSARVGVPLPEQLVEALRRLKAENKRADHIKLHGLHMDVNDAEVTIEKSDK